MYTNEIITTLEFLLEREEREYLDVLGIMEVLPHQNHIDSATAILARIESLETAVRVLKES